MSSLALFWQSMTAWQRTDLIGLSMVAIGVFGELALRFEFVKTLLKFPFNPTGFPPLDFRKNLLEIICEMLIFVGLGIEVFSLPNIINESHRQIAELNKQTEGLRNERVDLEKRVEQLRHENDVLEKTLQPRRITAQQKKDFIALLDNQPKAPVKVFVGLYDGETINYALQIRRLLDEAGYGSEKKDDITSIGPIAWVYNIGALSQDAPMKFVFVGKTNENNTFGGLVFGDTNGVAYVGYVGPKNDISRVPSSLDVAFQKIGIVPAVLITN